MTVSKAVEKADSMYPNSFAFSTKAQWLEELDGRIRREVLSLYPDITLPEEVSYSIFPETKLIVSSPFEELYSCYLSVKLCIAWGDTAGYKNASALFNSLYLSYMSYINREHRAKKVSINIE